MVYCSGLGKWPWARGKPIDPAEERIILDSRDAQSELQLLLFRCLKYSLQFLLISRIVYTDTDESRTPAARTRTYLLSRLDAVSSNRHCEQGRRDFVLVFLNEVESVWSCASVADRV